MIEVCQDEQTKKYVERICRLGVAYNKRVFSFHERRHGRLCYNKREEVYSVPHFVDFIVFDFAKT